MFPITVFKNKKHTMNFMGGNVYDFPAHIDPYQFEVSSDKELNHRVERNQSEVNVYLSDFQTFCFYCGEESQNIIPCFLHDGSGNNLWLLDDLRSSFVICQTCCDYAGKLNVSYRKRVQGVKKGRLAELLKFEPDVLLPTMEPVDLHFEFTLNGEIEPRSMRAQRTIERFSLNRPELIKRRRRAMDVIDFDDPVNNIYLDGVYPLDVCFVGLSTKQNSILPFNVAKNEISGFSSFYQVRLSTDEDFKYKSRVFKSTVKNIKNGRANDGFVGLERVLFSGIRNFQPRQEIVFSGKNSILLLGENGVGKSTLLSLLEKSIKPYSKFDLSKFVSKEASQSEQEVFVEYSNQEGFVHFQTNMKLEGRRRKCNVIKVAEGRISNSIIDTFESWLVEISKDEQTFSWVARRLKILLDFPNEYELISEENMSYWLDSASGRRKYLDEFSSGYRSLMTAFYLIVSKLYFQSEDSSYELEKSLSGTLVLIDEIELHLHPRLKMSVVGTLQEVFPQVLFIITTHDPLVIKSANAKTKILLLKENENRKTEINDNLPSHMFLNTEQILTSPFFGLDSTSKDERKDVWPQYHKALKDDDRKKASVYREQLADSGLFGSTYREYLAFSAVDAYLAKKKIPRADEIAELLEMIEADDA
jgi:energy-coupling factor transporter ATP-binding protein EcfA2